MSKVLDRDIEMLNRLVRTRPSKLARSYFPDSPNPQKTFDSWIDRIRDRRARFQIYINNINNICKKSNYIKKRLTVVNDEWEDEEDEFQL